MVESAVILTVGHPDHQSRLAYNRPRAMLPVVGKPLALRMLELVHRAGIRHFIVIVGENEGSVASHLHARLPDARVEFALQSSSSNLTRTLSAVAHQLDRAFLFASYHAFVHPHFPEYLLKNAQNFAGELVLCGAPTTLSNAGAVYAATTDGQSVTRISAQARNGQPDSMLLTDLAICGETFVHYLSDLFFNTSVFKNRFLDMAQLYLRTGGKAFVTETAWTLPVETDDDLLTLNRFFLDNSQDCHILSEIPSSVHIIPPVRIDPQVSVGQGAQLGPRVYLESGCSVGSHAVISDAVVLQSALVPARQRVSGVIVAPPIADSP